MLDQLVSIIRRCRFGVVLTGAGMSAESGVPTFRGEEGLWKKFRPEQLATVEAFLASPKIVWEWYAWRRELMSAIKPHAGYVALRELEIFFERLTVLTQNVDGLHASVGCDDLIELHGNIRRNKCFDCHAPWQSERPIDPEAIPICDRCGGQIRPDVVWFGEQLPETAIETAFRRAEQAEICFCIGTSAIVQPAASLPVLAHRSGATLVEINPEPTPLSAIADFSFREPAGQLLPRLVDLLRKSSTNEKSLT